MKNISWAKTKIMYLKVKPNSRHKQKQIISTYSTVGIVSLYIKRKVSRQYVQLHYEICHNKPRN